ncbi:MAG: LCP family protein [Acidimicrobiales bacterium]
MAASAGYAWYLNHKVHRIYVGGLTPEHTTSGKLADTENILMVGSTTRCGLTHQTPAYGLCTEGVTGVNSDVVMVLHLNFTTGAVSILSLPRDLIVPNARSTGTWKIDSALAQGPGRLVSAVEEDFAIPIQHYVELNFDTFAEVVTKLGGITMLFPDPVFDRFSGLKIMRSGCYHLDGRQALAVVRARHLQYYVTGDSPTYVTTWPQEAESDLARIRRDHEFLRVLASEIQRRGLGNPASDLSLIDALAPVLTVDSGFSASDMVHMALTFHTVNAGSAPTYTIPVAVGTFGTYTYDGQPLGDVEFPSEPNDESTIDAFLGVTSDTNTMTGKPLPSPSSVTVSVIDGTQETGAGETGAGETGAATTTATSLSGLGFQVVGTSSTTPVAQYSETLVTYSQRTPQDEAAAQLVANSLSGSVILHFGATTDGAQVTITTGTRFGVDATAPSGKSGQTTPTTATGSSQPTSLATPTAGDYAPTGTTSAFTAPTPSKNPLRSWDPRACVTGSTGIADPWNP